MSKNRLEAFSDGVIAIIITIMVLEMKVPHSEHEPTFRDLVRVWPVFVSYVLSFVYLGIYWNNHHHLLHAVQKVNGRVLWANLHLLFWLSLVPFVTGWMGENHFERVPTALYGVVLLMSGMAYQILQTALLGLHGRESTLAQAVGRDFKGRISLLCYAIGIGVSYALPAAGWVLYALVAIMWLAPDPRIERRLSASPQRLPHEGA